MTFSKVIFLLIASVCVACEVTPNASKEFADEEKQAQLEANIKTEVLPQLKKIQEKQAALQQQKAQHEAKEGTEPSQAMLKKQLEVKASQLEVLEAYLKLKQTDTSFSEEEKIQMEQDVQKMKEEIQVLKEKLK